MTARTPHRLVALPALVALLALACGGGPDRGRSIESLELVDFTASGMFVQLSLQLGRPYLLELPSGANSDQQDLRLEDSDERAVLEELRRIDPRFQYRMEGPAWMFFPAGEVGDSSPFARRVEVFNADGGAFAVLQQLASGALPKDTVLGMHGSGKARPVAVQLENVTVREVLAEIAAQAQLGITVEPGYVRVSVVPEP